MNSIKGFPTPAVTVNISNYTGVNDMATEENTRYSVKKESVKIVTTESDPSPNKKDIVATHLEPYIKLVKHTLQWESSIDISIHADDVDEVCNLLQSLK